MNCVFAGSFDPITLGHERIIEKCLSKFDKVFIVIGVNPDKTPLFPLPIRKEFLQSLYNGNDRIEIVDYISIKDYKKFLTENGIEVYVRGIRDEKDMEYEKEYEKENLTVYPFVKTEYLYSDNPEISSSKVKEKIARGEDFSAFLSPSVFSLIKKFSEKNK